MQPLDIWSGVNHGVFHNVETIFEWTMIHPESEETLGNACPTPTVWCRQLWPLQRREETCP